MSQSCLQSNTKTSKPLPDGYAFYKGIGSPRFICAPMVEQSELPFRLLCRDYNVPLCYSPMINSKHFLQHPKYAECVFQTCSTDRPLIAQFCANDPQLLLNAVKKVENEIDAVDLNFGCPQGIARRGNYGAFLLTQVDTMCKLVNILHKNISIPVCAKIRIVDDEKETLRICKLLRENGISILTVHGRTIKSKKQKTGNCDFEIIKKIKQMMDIPVFANGGCETMEDVEKCLELTGCDGYMAAESLLSNPSMFIKENEENKCNNSDYSDPFKISRDYIRYCKLCKNEKDWIIRNKHVAMKGHLFKILYRELTIFQDIRNYLGYTDNVEWIWNVVDLLQVRRKNMNKNLYKFIYDKFTINWYHRHWKSYDKLDLMDTWDLIINECTKPIEENEMELIELLIKYKTINFEQCQSELNMNQNDIISLKEIIRLKREKEEMERNNNKIITETEGNLINSMFGMHQDDSDDDQQEESDQLTSSQESIIYDID